MKRIERTFKLKGGRNYIHGTDIFDQVLKEISDQYDRISDFEIVFSRRIENTSCSWYCAAEKSELGAMSAPCRGSYQLDEAVHYFLLVPQEEQGPRRRVDYDEGEMTVNAHLTYSAAGIRANGKFTFIENLVALNKHFHNSNYKPARNQWMFGKLELSTVPKDVESIEIRLESMIPNRLSKCGVIVDNESVGFIFFTVG